MSVAAVAMVKDEADVIAGTISHLAHEGVDRFVIADNGSTDGTRDILDWLAETLPISITDDPEVGYYQSAKVTRLARIAAEEHGATWIVPFDADEVWVFAGDRIATELEASTADVIGAALFNHFPSAIDPPGADPFRTILWRQPGPAPLPKVAFRWRDGAVIQQGNHGVTLPGDVVMSAGLQIRHFPYRTVEQFIRKARNGAAAYRATDLPADVGAHWRGYGDLHDRGGDEALADVFRTYFWNLSPADAGLVLDPAPYLRWPDDPVMGAG